MDRSTVTIAEGVVHLDLAVKVALSEFREWESWRIRQFFDGIAMALEARDNKPTMRPVDSGRSADAVPFSCPGCGKPVWVGRLHNCTGELRGRA